jgi:hypothetical protein
MISKPVPEHRVHAGSLKSTSIFALVRRHETAVRDVPPTLVRGGKGAR